MLIIAKFYLYLYSSSIKLHPNIYKGKNHILVDIAQLKSNN